jgi:hypothetical protein
MLLSNLSVISMPIISARNLAEHLLSHQEFEPIYEQLSLSLAHKECGAAWP